MDGFSLRFCSEYFVVRLYAAVLIIFEGRGTLSFEEIRCLYFILKPTSFSLLITE